MLIKEELKQICLNRIQAKIDETNGRISSLQKDLLSETKSSAGDKHETGRAMIHLEIEKESQKLQNFSEMKETCLRIKEEEVNSVIALGSIVTTPNMNYFMNVSLGLIETTSEEKFYVISSNSPVGKLLLGKKEGDSIHFNGREIHINSIS